MKIYNGKRIALRYTAVLLSVCFVLFGFAPYAAAAESPAYTDVLAQEPKHITDVEFEDMYAFFKASTTDAILDPAECNYAYGLVTVNGEQINCHVYQRTFNITDISGYPADDVLAMLPKIITRVREATADKYLKCIAKSYSVNVSGSRDEENGVFTSLRIRILFAVGEKTEDRAALIEDYVRPEASRLSELDTLERFVTLNETLLDGRFSYDTELNNRSSAVALVADGRGVCEDYAALTSLFLDALGYENAIITGTTADGVRHMWNMVCADGRWYHLDILWDGPIDETGKHISVNRSCLLVSTETISKTRTPDEAYEEYCGAAVYDYVFEGLPDGVRGTTLFNGTEYFAGVPTLTTVSELRETTQLSDFLVITKADGTPLAEDAYVGTGCVMILNVNGVVLKTLPVCVKSDIDGDGRITAADIAKIAAYRLGAPGDYGDSFLLAADRNLDGEVTVTDLIIAYDVMNGTYIEPSGDNTPVQTEPETDAAAPEEIEDMTVDAG